VLGVGIGVDAHDGSTVFNKASNASRTSTLFCGCSSIGMLSLLLNLRRSEGCSGGHRSHLRSTAIDEQFNAGDKTGIARGEK
jgi:hypothetical protein